MNQLKLKLGFMGIAIGLATAASERYLFALALGRSIDWGEPFVFVVNAFFASIPLMTLAARQSARWLPWTVAIVATVAVRWWYVSLGVDYQRAPDGSGVPMGEAMIVLLSPIVIAALVLLIDKTQGRLNKSSRN